MWEGNVGYGVGGGVIKSFCCFCVGHAVPHQFRCGGFVVWWVGGGCLPPVVLGNHEPSVTPTPRYTKALSLALWWTPVQ